MDHGCSEMDRGPILKVRGSDLGCMRFGWRQMVANDTRVDVCKCQRSEIWEYRIYTQGVSGYAAPKLAYLSPSGARRAALKIGCTMGIPVFDSTNIQFRKQIWPQRP